MGFSGKPSKGCLPCRQKRTKCDLALPSCTQCVRKNRMCFGYRNEQDMVFRNETGLIIRKVKRKSSDGESSTSSGSPFDEDAFAPLELSALVAHPSRRATLQDEAIMHWMANFNEKFFSSSSVENLQAGFEYIMPIYQRDLERNGPAVEIVHACGLAALGNAKGAPDLLRAARVKQIKVLRQLNEQLQDPEHGLSDSSLLTCLLLSSFENMVCEGSESMAASQMHLRGAATLVKLRGKSQFSSMIGRGMFVRLRGSMLALSLLTSEPLPDYLFQHLKEECLTEESFEVKFFRFMNRVCHLRSQHKHKGFIDSTMVAEAHATLHHISTWNPKFPPWVLPDGHRSQFKGKNVVPGMLIDGADKVNRFIWVAMSWLFLNIAEILVHELLIVYFRAQIEISPHDPELKTSLQTAMAAQFEISRDVQDAVERAYAYDAALHLTRGVDYEPADVLLDSEDGGAHSGEVCAQAGEDGGGFLDDGEEDGRFWEGERGRAVELYEYGV
ncbi:hypothetical protein GRF29_213g232367 [Pseudopithomyces chartarum]|uniref:Zn(2)-C6 fungal-type domain-containing protein n=1 Tax=Pseudopithomyces chartarum TaxID=1892770 RepID=A0AAN6LRT0_9PLEO|nr:hypothetical protein GRF29_213g232367 [Pseudopithomyces chartarum]